MSIVQHPQANNGAVACQLLDRLNPLSPEIVNMRKVDCNAVSAYNMEQNWRILQRAFTELEIDWVRQTPASAAAGTQSSATTWFTC